MAKFAYNNAKNTSTGHMPFKLNYGFYPRVFFKDNINPYSRSCSANELAKKLKELIDICQQNLLHAQKLQKRAHDKSVKLQSYASERKFDWIANTSKQSKIKNSRPFFGLSRIIYLVRKQAYKLDLHTK